MKYFNESAKMLATALYLMRGTPFIYQGEEIGMTNYPFTKFSEYRDVSTINQYHNLVNMTEEEKMWHSKKTSRDNPRTPIQWDSSKYAGFSNVKPWINVNPNYVDINVESNLKDKDSIWYHYKKVIDLRLNSIYRETIIYGGYNQIDLNNDKVYIYERKDNNNCLLIINSFAEESIDYNLSNYKIKKVILSNYKDSIINNNNIKLRPFESIVLEVIKNE